MATENPFCVVNEEIHVTDSALAEQDCQTFSAAQEKIQEPFENDDAEVVEVKMEDDDADIELGGEIEESDKNSEGEVVIEVKEENVDADLELGIKIEEPDRTSERVIEVKVEIHDPDIKLGDKINDTDHTINSFLNSVSKGSLSASCLNRNEEETVSFKTNKKQSIKKQVKTKNSCSSLKFKFTKRKEEKVRKKISGKKIVTKKSSGNRSKSYNIKKSTKQNEILKYPVGPYDCDKCGTHLTHYSSIRYHMRRHMQVDMNKSYNLCEICGKSFIELNELKLHVRRHSGDKPHVCNFENCSKAFLTRSLLKIHQNSVHFDIRPYQCKECSKEFRRRGAMNVHIANQHRQKNCPKCGEIFAQKINLITHIKSHEDPSVLWCNLCERKFRCKTTLQKHLLSHKRGGYRCEECEEVFTRQSYLTEHQWKHTGML